MPASSHTRFDEQVLLALHSWKQLPVGLPLASVPVCAHSNPAPHSLSSVQAPLAGVAPTASQKVTSVVEVADVFVKAQLLSLGQPWLDTGVQLIAQMSGSFGPGEKQVDPVPKALHWAFVVHVTSQLPSTQPVAGAAQSAAVLHDVPTGLPLGGGVPASAEAQTP